METAKAIAESDRIPDDRKEGLAQQVLNAGASVTSQTVWDNWAQRIVAGGLGLIGIVLSTFVGISVIQGHTVQATVMQALTAVVAGLAGMFTQKALGASGGSNGNASQQQEQN